MSKQFYILNIQSTGLRVKVIGKFDPYDAKQEQG
jgi:hypothetical protein